jgi:C-terminal region of aryl-sulfatase
MNARTPRRADPSYSDSGGHEYFSDDGDLMALRYKDWKVVFMEHRAEGTLKTWANPFTELRVPKIFNLRRDPYERADITSNTYYDWMISRAYILVPAQAFVGKFLHDGIFRSLSTRGGIDFAQAWNKTAPCLPGPARYPCALSGSKCTDLGGAHHERARVGSHEKLR